MYEKCKTCRYLDRSRRGAAYGCVDPDCGAPGYHKYTPKNMELILDACCGSKMFWFNKEHPNTIFMDERSLETTLCDGRMLKIAPDIIADFKNIQFPDNKFKLVVFGPPHLIKAGEDSWLKLKYGC